MDKLGKRLLAVVLAVLLVCSMGIMRASAATDITGAFTDPNFLAVVRERIGKPTGPIYDTDVQYIPSLSAAGMDITSLAGLEYFTALNTFDCQWNQLTELPDLPLELTSLSCGYNQLTVLPELPPDLEMLNCYDNQLTSLPALPVGLVVLSCGGNLLTELPTLPSGLESLGCGENLLTVLPALPLGLTNLNCIINQLTELPALPSGLTDLNCGANPLTELPTLPSGLESLGCGGSLLTELPALPSTLIILDCNDNQLTELPELPSGLFGLDCQENLLTELPVLPPGLDWLDCSNNQLTALPELPSTLTTLHCEYNQLTVLPELPPLLWLIYCGDNLLTSLPTLPPDLEILECSENLLTELPALPSGLIDLVCNNNKLTGIDVTGLLLNNRSYSFLWCQYNNMTSPDDVVGFTRVWDGVQYIFYPQNTLGTSYTLTLNPNGGSVTPTTQTGTQGQTYTLPTPTRSGYTFTSWTLSGGGSLSGNVYTFGTSDGTVTAQWTANPTEFYAAPFWYEKENGEAIITRYDTPLPDVLTIPATLVGLPVKLLEAQLFQGAAVKEIILSDGLQTIGAMAFRNCTVLEKITIPASVTSFGMFAFNGCPNLTLYVYENSPAHSYAIDNSIPFVLIDVLTDPATGLTINDPDGILPSGVVLSVVEVPEGNYKGNDIALIFNPGGTQDVSLVLYDIILTDGSGNVLHDLGGYVTVKLPLPNDWNTKNYQLYYIDPDNRANPFQVLSYQVIDGYAVFQTNHLSIYGFVAASSPAANYTVTVNSGTGSGSYAANATVNITANAAPSGKVFDKWTTADGVAFANANATSTSFTMPAKNVTVTATYKDAPPSKGIFGTNAKWYGAWWHYLLFFLCFGFIWMW